MVPWVIMYALNILGMVAISFVMFYSFPGGYKALGFLVLLVAAVVFVGYCFVVFFVIEQRTDLDIYTTQQANSQDRISPS